MEDQFLNLTEENLDWEHLCCIIWSKKPHPGVDAKRAWLRERLHEGHMFRKPDAKGVVFIEYAHLETARPMPEPRESPACVCRERKSKRPGSQTGPSQKSMDLNR